MWVPSVPRKSVLLFSANQVPTTASCGVLREKKTLDNSAHFFDTDKRHIRVFQKKGERILKGGWRGNSTRGMGGRGNTEEEKLLHSFAK